MVMEKIVEDEKEIVLFAGRLETRGKGPWIVVEDYCKDPMPAKRFKEKTDALSYRLDRVSDARNDRMLFVGVPTPEDKALGLVGFIEDIGMGYYRVPMALVLLDEEDGVEEIVEKGVDLVVGAAKNVFSPEVMDKVEAVISDLILSEPGSLRRFYDAFTLLDRIAGAGEKLDKADERLRNGDDPEDVINSLLF